MTIIIVLYYITVDLLYCEPNIGNGLVDPVLVGSYCYIIRTLRYSLVVLTLAHW